MPITKEQVIAYKEKLTQGYKPTRVNSMLAAINGFLLFKGYGDCRVKQMKTQRKVFCSETQQLTKVEYRRLVEAARQMAMGRLVWVSRLFVLLVPGCLLICEMAAEAKAMCRTLVDKLNEIYAEYGYYHDAIDTFTLRGKDGLEM